MSIPKASIQGKCQKLIFAGVVMKVPDDLPETSQHHQSIESFVNGTIRRGFFQYKSPEGHTMMVNCTFNGFNERDYNQKALTVFEIAKSDYGNGKTMLNIAITKIPHHFNTRPAYKLIIDNDINNSDTDLRIGNKILRFEEIN